MSPRIGSLFSGYGGLDMGVLAALGGSVAWHVEYDKAPSKILAHHWPEVPNYGDVTAVDWSAVEPVDIITGGSPCQDLSHAGKRQGMTEGTRSNLWVAMREAIAQLRPSLVVWENVRGAASAEATSDLEFCSGCMGEAWDRGPVLRALGRVVGDLADLGYVGRLWGLRAADIGGCHGRFRYFLAANPQGDTRWLQYGNHATASDPNLSGGEARHGRSGAGVARRSQPLVGGDSLLPTPTTSDSNGVGAHGDGGIDLRTALSLLPTPSAADGNGGGRCNSPGHQATLPGTARLLPTPRAGDGTKGGPNQRGSSGDLMLPSAVTLLPTPAVNDMGAAYTPETWDEWTAKMKVAHGNGNGHGPSLNVEAQRLATDAREDACCAAYGQSWVTSEGVDYGPAVRRWHDLTRCTPDPTEVGGKGGRRLSPAFSEWMMGLPAGHVTDVPGLSRNDQLKALGNGVVPQQAAAALRFLLNVQDAAA